MATMEQLETALRNAHKAGDAKSAKALAKEIVRMRGAAQEQAPVQAASQMPQGDPSRWGMSNEAMDTVTMGLQSKGNAMLGAGLDYITGQEGNYWQNYDKHLSQQRADQQAYNQQNPVRSGIGDAAGVALGITSLPTIGRGLAGAVATGASYGATGGAAQDAETWKDRAKNVAVGSASGGLLGGALYGAAKGVQKLITPFPMSAERQRLAGVLENEGVDLTAGQKTGNQTLRYMESELGGRKGAAMMERQGEQFTGAALKKAGTPGNRATPSVINQAFDDIGQQFDNLAARNSIIPDQQLVNDVSRVASDYANIVAPNGQVPLVAKTVSDITQGVQSGSISGDAYKAMRSRLSRSTRGMADPEAKMAINGLIESLDDAMERSIVATGSPDAGAWAQIRNQYRNLLVVEQAATGAGEKAAEGLISPSALRNATVQKQSRRAYARGKGDFADLARAGEALMKPLPNSGTAPRTAVRAMGASVPAILGAGAGSTAGPGGMIAGGLLGAALPYGVGRMLLSAPMKAYLANQLLGGAGQIGGNIALRLTPQAAGYVGNRGLLGSP